jgi:hypothetical protein
MPITTPIANQGVAQAAVVANPTVAGQAGITTMTDQLGGVLNQGGPLMQQAATQGNQQAASRGLLNSSMGIQAAQGAVLQQATNIAQNNMQALNQGNQFNTGQSNAISLENQKAQNQANQFNTQQGNAMNQWNAGQKNELIKSTMDINSRESLANIEANYKTLLQANASASGMYEQYLKNISDISQSDIDAGAKANSIANQVGYLRAGLQMVSNMNSIAGMITF